MKTLLLVATRHNEGKTLLALGLAKAFSKTGVKVGYFKPIGHRSVESDDSREDSDAKLMQKAAGLTGQPAEISPVLLQGFPSDWTTREGHEAVLERIRKAHAKVSAGCDVLIVEATGNAAAGAAFGMSNAYLARRLDAKVVLVASGGVGQPTDEVILNKSYLERTGVGVMGVFINKAYPHETERLNTFMRRVLETINLRLLGTVPYDPELARPTLKNLAEEFRGQPLCGEGALLEATGRFVLGASNASAVSEQFKGRVTLICPVDREDLLEAALAATRRRGRSFQLASVVFAGLGRPGARLLQTVRKAEVPSVHIEIDAYSLSFLIHSTRYKIAPEDAGRIRRAEELVGRHIDLDQILDRMAR